MQTEIANTLKRALEELEKPVTAVGTDGWKRAGEYAERCGYAMASIRQCLQLLGEKSAKTPNDCPKCGSGTCYCQIAHND